MALADGHQPLADIGAGRHPHAQAVARVLVDKSPIGAHQQAPLGLADAVDVQVLTQAVAKDNPPGRGTRRADKRFSKVDLPEPDSPTMPITSPR